MPAGSEFPELRKPASQNFSSPPKWDSSNLLRRPAPLPKNTAPDFHPVGTSPTKQSPTKSFTPSSVHRRLNSLQTQSSSNVRELSNVFNNQIGGSKPTNGISTSPFKNESPVAKKERERDVSTVSIPPMFGSVKPKAEPPMARMPPAYDAPVTIPNTAPPPVATPVVPLTSNGVPDRFSSAISSGDFHILSGQLNNLLTISNSLQKEMANLSRRSKDNAMDLMSLKEATNHRDEDIRKSLKDLASGLTRPGGRLALTSTNDTLDFDNALTRYGSAPDVHRSFVSDAEEVLRQSHAKRKSIGKDIQATMETHSTDRILREMATKESQRRVTDLLENIQTEVLSQGKTTSSKISEVLRNIQSAGLRSSSPNAAVRYPSHSQEVDNDNSLILGLLEVLKTSMEERMDDLQNSLSLINNTPPNGLGDVSSQLKPVEDALQNHIKATEEVKDLISNLQLTGPGYSPLPIVESLSSQIRDLALRLESLPVDSNIGILNEKGAVSTIELKDMLKTLIEMASRNEAGTYKAAEVLNQKLGEISAAVSRGPAVPSSPPGESSATVQNAALGLEPTLAGLKATLGDMQGDICAQEKVVEKALEIILRELNKVTPTIESKIVSADEIASATQINLREDFGNVQTKIATVEGTMRDSMNVIQTQLQVITESAAAAQMFTPRGEVREGEAPPPRVFDGSVAAVSAIGAMGKDLKHTMENLQSDINGRERVTEKAMEIILREIATINKSVGGVPMKIVDGVRDALGYGDGMKQAMQDLQADVLGREKHTEKALEIILRELQTVAANFDKAQLAIAHSQEQKSSVVNQAEKDIKFNLETIVTRSSRIADTTASIQEILEAFQKAQTEANDKVSDTTQSLAGSLESSVKAPVEELSALLKTVQEQFKSTTSNTAQSIIEVAKYLDTLGDKASTNAEQIESVKTSISSVQENIQNFNSSNKEMNATLIERLESMLAELQESGSKAIEAAKGPVEEELAQEKDANSKVMDELKSLIDSLKEGFAQSVVTTEARNSELSKQLDSYCQSAREDQQQTQNDIKSVKESVLSLQSDDGTLAKILLAMKDVAEYLARPAAAPTGKMEGNLGKAEGEDADMELKDNTKLDEILKSMVTKEDLNFAEILKSIPTKEDFNFAELLRPIATKEDIQFAEILEAMLKKEDINLATKGDLKFTQIIDTMATKEDLKFSEIIDTMATKEDLQFTKIIEAMPTKSDLKFMEILDTMMTREDPKLAEIHSSMLTKEDPRLDQILESMATKEDPRFGNILELMLRKDDAKFIEIHSSMLTKDDVKLAEIHSSMLTKEDPKLAEIQISVAGLSEQIKSLTLTAPAGQENDNAVNSKLETLISHSNHQAKLFSQLNLLDDIQKKVEGTSSQVGEFITNQTTLIQTHAATERHAAAEATLAKEKALAERSVVEATTAALKAEELNLQNSICSLRLDNDDLSKRKHHLAAELSSIETALALRREELALLEARAETLERRMLEGVINQSRSLLLAKSTTTPGKPLRRVISPPVFGTTRSANGASGRRIVSMNIANSGAIMNSLEPQNRTPSGSAIFSGTPTTIRRTQSVRTSTQPSRKTSWSTIEPVIQDERGGENKENESAIKEGGSQLDTTVLPLAKMGSETGLATLQTIEDDDTDRYESADKAAVLGGDDVVKGEKRYPSGLSAASRRSDSVSSRATQDEEVD
ncbi:hypothetical protein AOL_s00109g172 [Orbilia oligospora ATCC 24927]|uniref:Uncharacterized protein n=1 Tax=Arthrobotrys oligospora (strain ATCC 24927 / CBS 115.81 / DSM 1491) TaxID=756982 RepID=G1XKE3_ARTOA|nr:hypothetical protein AOL_s00109g172 [Orbilia oligospora ATCC 24927]EGX46414.1 hypothetical protein AOL_s00109g172 [Orbilia oligospora ATCC 24927]